METSYTSRIRPLWIKLMTGHMEGTFTIKVGLLPTQEEFNIFCDGMYRIEGYPLRKDEEMAEELLAIRLSMAESNIIAHYTDQSLPFPEKLHALDGLPGDHCRRPQFGLDPATGEPWFAIKSSAKGVKAALIAGDQDRELANLTHPFVLRYERLEDCVILIPEFKHLYHVGDASYRKNFELFRSFLNQWADDGGRWSDGDRRVPIATAFWAFKTIINPAMTIPLALPEGFNYNLAFNQHH